MNNKISYEEDKELDELLKEAIEEEAIEEEFGEVIYGKPGELLFRIGSTEYNIRISSKKLIQFNKVMKKALLKEFPELRGGSSISHRSKQITTLIYINGRE